MSTTITLISGNTFHRRVKLSTAQGLLTVSFADIGCATGPVVLYLPGMFASRYLGIPMHVMAERAGVRLLVVDRPGMGASTDVPLAKRIDVWVDIVPRLLTHLGIPSVTLASHSAGTIYLLNTWARCQGLVNQHIVLLAPWVDPAHSRVTAMQMAQNLPSKAFTLWHHIPRFFITQASPVLASSGAAVRQISMISGIGSLNQTKEDRSFLDANSRRFEQDYGVPHGEQVELARLSARFMFAEDTVGANSEALQCLRKGAGADWGACTDYASFALMITSVERNAGRRVRLQAYFAAKDAMVGSRGQKYLEECWSAPGVEEGVDFVSTTVNGTDHDTVAQSVDVWEAIFTLVKQGN
ncbi:alpha/beta fold hydrolase [Aspergillus foveolatus]|uniref:alpha/beta fold hydrolase n=1 Tax=Aspergillus foveolatus TaxID=210207 RepID=UPI003CCCC2DF